MTKQVKYNEDDIQVLEGLEAVRKRPGMYIGSTNSTGLHHLVWEIIDNSIDEALNGYGNKISVTINKDGSITIADEGRGIPCGIHKKENIPTIQLLLTTLHSGGKFSDSAYSSSAGLHGVGSSVTNALSEFMDVTVYRDGQIHHIRFEKGGSVLKVPYEILGPTRRTGTVTTFKPDKTIFSTSDFKYDTIKNRIQESAFLLQGVRFYLKDERTSSQVVEFYYQNGLEEYIETLNSTKKHLIPVCSFEDNTSDIKMKIAIQYCKNDYNETILSYVNNIRTRDGGTHETGFKTALNKAINDYAENNKLLKNRARFEASDIREGLTAIISLKIPESILEFEGQTKGKLGTPEAQTAVSNFFYDAFSHYLVENKEKALEIVAKCNEAQRVRIATRKAKDELRSVKKKKVEVILSDKLTQASSKEYHLNELFIVEGDSAGGTAKRGRDHLHQAILPLRGKPLNVATTTIDKAMTNEEIKTLINTIGAGIAQNFDLSSAKYGKIIIMTDADVDGAHIQILLLTFFYQYMRPLIDAGMVYVAMPPLYRVYSETGKKNYIYCWTEEDLAEAKKKIPGGRVNRYKGLGEMNDYQLRETTMSKATRRLLKVQIQDPLMVEQSVNTLMGNDASLRRRWIEENVDFTVVDNFVKEAIHE